MDFSSPLQAKDTGNNFMKIDDVSSAIEAYTFGIQLIKQGHNKSDDLIHVLFSNRSAAYLRKADDKSLQLSLADAEECIRLKPSWSRGYGRLGNVLNKLGEHDRALEVYEEGHLLERGNAELKQNVKRCREIIAQKELNPDVKGKETEVLSSKKEAEDDDTMEAFMAELVAAEKSAQKAANEAQKYADLNEAEEEVERAKRFVDHETEISGWTSANQTKRLLRSGYIFWNANPFETLGLKNENCDESDIRKRFILLSTLVHPDKNAAPSANEAFQEVKAAYEKLKDNESRKRIVTIITQCRQRIRATRTRLLSKRLSQAELEERDGTEDEAMEAEIRKEFGERELIRRQAEANLKKHGQREMEAQSNEKEYWESVKNVEKELREGREERAKNWHGFSKKMNKRKRDF